MKETKDRKEVMEAMAAADMAIMSLEQARAELTGAKNWGLMDMFGGGLFATIFKHSRMDDAKASMNEAKDQLRTLKRELLDVKISEDFNLEVGDFLSFADYFFDGFVADFMVQEKINDAAGQVEEAISNVRSIRAVLQKMLLKPDSRNQLDNSEGGTDVWDV